MLQKCPAAKFQGKCGMFIAENWLALITTSRNTTGLHCEMVIYSTKTNKINVASNSKTLIHAVLWKVVCSELN